MANTPDPRDFYQVSRLVLMPSLWWESFPRVAVEALINGIPVLGSRRGGLPETLEHAGFLVDVPKRYTRTVANRRCDSVADFFLNAGLKLADENRPSEQLLRGGWHGKDR